MEGNRLKVLSIDFDYFQNVDLETLASYPDGIDLGSEISRIVWAGHYVNKRDAEKILSVGVDEDKIEHIKRIISDSWGIGTDVMICNSHKNIYKFILDSYNNVGCCEGVDIYNVDMHHDMFNDNPDVDCGNWVSHILSDIENSSITWIANPVSKDAYGMDKERFSMVSETLDDLDCMDFDIIFLCRSDIWTPPHIDSYFKDLAYSIIDEFENVLVEPSVLEERDYMSCVERIKGLIDNNRSIKK